MLALGRACSRTQHRALDTGDTGGRYATILHDHTRLRTQDTRSLFPPDKELDSETPKPHNIIINNIIIIIIVIEDFFRCAAFLPDRELSDTL